MAFKMKNICFKFTAVAEVSKEGWRWFWYPKALQHGKGSKLFWLEFCREGGPCGG